MVANDTVRNFLFVNQGHGRFREAGRRRRPRLRRHRQRQPAPWAWIAAWFDNDAKLAIAIGNFANEMSSFYVVRAGESAFSDDAIVAGVGAPSRRALTFGLAFLDADLDGRLDLLAANGHVEPEIGRVQASQRYAQPPQLFWNCGPRCGRRYAPAAHIGDLGQARVGRGPSPTPTSTATGDLDVALTETGGAAALLRNDQASGVMAGCASRCGPSRRTSTPSAPR